MARLLFTAKSGGLSEGHYSSLNLGLHVGDDFDKVLKNREVIRQAMSVEKVMYMNQVHGNDVAFLDESALEENTGKQITADALVTTTKGLGLAVLVADCLPILIWGESCVAAIHVGRRGMANGIIGHTIDVMRRHDSSRLEALIGPGICGSCYEVDLDTYSQISKQFPSSDGGLCKIDIKAESIHQLKSLEVNSKVLETCTLENSNYFSYRREKVCGRQGGIICL